MTSSNGNIFRVTVPLSGESNDHRCIPLTKGPVIRSFDVFFNLCLKKRLSKQSRRRWFETLSRSLWHHYNVAVNNICRNDMHHTLPFSLWCSLVCISSIFHVMTSWQQHSPHYWPFVHWDNAIGIWVNPLCAWSTTKCYSRKNNKTKKNKKTNKQRNSAQNKTVHIFSTYILSEPQGVPYNLVHIHLSEYTTQRINT